MIFDKSCSIWLALASSARRQIHQNVQTQFGAIFPSLSEQKQSSLLKSAEKSSSYANKRGLLHDIW